MAILQQLVTPRTVYIHKETNNQSFLDMHHYLAARGIQNNDFFLVLLDPGLAGIDPRDENLPSYMKARVLQECKNNYWYFLREIVRIPEQGGEVNGGAKYKLHRGNLAMNFLFVLNFNMFVEMPRQHGKTTAALVRYLWLYNFGTSNSEIMFMHKDHTGSKKNLKELKKYREALPSYLQMSSAIDSDGKKLKVPNTVVTIEHPFNHNKIITVPSARTKDSADQIGRGNTQPCQYYDEFAFIPYNELVYQSAIPANSRASENAAKHGAPYGVLLTTTPGDLLTESGAYAYQKRNDATPFYERYYDLSYQALLEIKNSNQKSSFFLISYSYQQLGSGQDYFRKMIVEMGQDWPRIRREVLLEWSTVAGNCPFSQEDLDRIKALLKEPIREIAFGKWGQYVFQVYEDIDTNYPPIVGVDIAGAMWQDSSAITIIDSKTTKVTACFNCNFIPSDDLAEVIYELVTKYLPNACVTCERNGGFGVSVIQRLCKTSVKKNLYWSIKDKVIEESFNGIHAAKRTAKVKVYGVDSTKEVRARLIELLYDRVQYHKDKIISPIIFKEMEAMTIKKNGKVEHSDNTHDDQVFSWLHALYVWYDGENLAEKFHILKNTIKTDENIELEEASFEDQLECKEQVDLSQLNTDENSETIEALRMLDEMPKFTLSTDFHRQLNAHDIEFKQTLLTTNKPAREAYSKLTGLDPSNFGGFNNYSMTVLPDSLFMDDENNLNLGDDEQTQTHSILCGNMSSMWNEL